MENNDIGIGGGIAILVGLAMILGAVCYSIYRLTGC